MLEKYNDVLTINDLQEILHYRSKTTVYQILREGKIKSIHNKRGKWLIPKQNVIKYLLNNNNCQCYNNNIH